MRRGRGRGFVQRDPRLPDVAQPALRVAIQTAAQQALDSCRRLRRQLAELDWPAQHAGQRVRYGLALKQAATGQAVVWSKYSCGAAVVPE
jgi:hypothetical protein